MTNPDAGPPARPWLATCLAVVGWIGIILPFAYVHWRYQIRYGFVPPMGLFVTQVSFWFVTGVTLVAVDTFRSKTPKEKVFWTIAAILWAMAAFTAFVTNFEPDWLGRLPSNPFIRFIIGEFMPLEMFGTVLVLTPVYVLYLSLVAIKAWLLIHGHRQSFR